MAVLDTFIAISKDLNLKFSQGSMPPDPPYFAHAYMFRYKTRKSQRLWDIFVLQNLN